MPKNIVAYDKFNDLWHDKFGAFYAIDKVFSDMSKVTYETDKNLKYKVTIPVLQVEVTLIDMSLIDDYIQTFRSVLVGLCWLWLGVCVVNEFSPKFNVG